MTAFKFWQSVANTPFWMYLFFLYVIAFTYRTTKPQIVPYTAVKLAPLGVATLAIICMFTFLQVTITNLAYLITALAAGFIIGWIQYRIKNIKADADSKTIHLPGTYVLCITVCCAIFAKFYYSYTPDYADFNITLGSIANAYSDKIMVLLGLSCGLMIGRFIYAKKVMREGPYFLTA